MNTPRTTEMDFIQFIIASPKVCSATEAARSQPAKPEAPAHDSFTRLLNRLEPDAETLWLEVQPLIVRSAGVLVIDDSTLDKPYAKKMDLVGYHWSGNQHRVVQGINLLSLAWTDGDRIYPCDYRVYDSQDEHTKNDLARTMLEVAFQRGFQPKYVLFDSWYASIDNLKAVRAKDWKFLSRMKSNRKIRINHGAALPVGEAAIAAEGTIVWLPKFGEVKVFRVVAKNGDTTHWFSNDLAMTELTRVGVADLSWQIEEYHRGIKQHCGVARCQSRSGRAQRNYIRISLRAFVRLEFVRFRQGWSWFESKMSIIRSAVADYLKNPWIQLNHELSA